MPTTNGTLYIRNDWVIRVRLKRWDPTVSERLSATGLTVTGLITATAGGAAINPALSLTLEEGAEGDYSAPVAAADQVTYLLSYVGKTVYERVFTSDGTFDESRPLLVADQRIGD